MNLKEQGYRFILRPVDGHIDGRWMHQTDIKPEWLDCTDMEDDVFASRVTELRLWLENRREQV